MADDRTFNVTIQAEIRTADGQPFADETLKYYGMSYVSVVELETIWGKLHQQLVELGQQKAEKFAAVKNP